MGAQRYGTEPADYSCLSGHRDSSKMPGVPIHKGLISILCILVTDGYISAIRQSHIYVHKFCFNS